MENPKELVMLNLFGFAQDRLREESGLAPNPSFRHRSFVSHSK
jgi:hypothetical protein